MKLIGKIILGLILFAVIIYALKLVFLIAAWSLVTILGLVIKAIPIVAVIIFIAWIRKHYFKKK